MRSTFSARLTRAITGTSGARSLKITVAKSVVASVLSARITACTSAAPACFKSGVSRTLPTRLTPGPGRVSIRKVSSPASFNSSTTLRPTSPPPASAFAKVHEALQTLSVADQDQNAAGLEAHFRSRRRDQLAADPLADHRHAGVLAEVGLGQRFAAEHAVARDARFADLQFIAEVLDAGHGRADFLARARGEGG